MLTVEGVEVEVALDSEEVPFSCIVIAEYAWSSGITFTFALAVVLVDVVEQAYVVAPEVPTLLVVVEVVVDVEDVVATVLEDGTVVLVVLDESVLDVVTGGMLVVEDVVTGGMLVVEEVVTGGTV